jgi:hypothetical protein
MTGMGRAGESRIGGFERTKRDESEAKAPCWCNLAEKGEGRQDVHGEWYTDQNTQADQSDTGGFLILLAWTGRGVHWDFVHIMLTLGLPAFSYTPRDFSQTMAAIVDTFHALLDQTPRKNSPWTRAHGAQSNGSPPPFSLCGTLTYLCLHIIDRHP